VHASLGFGVVAGLLLALVLIPWGMWRHRKGRRQAHRETRNAARTGDMVHTIMGPTTVREAEDRIPTIDDHGNRHLVIRTRTLETVLGPIGAVEVERQRRLTLPGHGHVIAVSDTEFEIFHTRTRLRIEGAAPSGAPRSASD
jgi:preprotein translocase subunit YajC